MDGATNASSVAAPSKKAKQLFAKSYNCEQLESVRLRTESFEKNYLTKMAISLFFAAIAFFASSSTVP